MKSVISWCKDIYLGSSGNLMATLAVIDSDPPFTTLEELARYPGFEVGIQNSTVWIQVFKVIGIQMIFLTL